MKIGLGQVSRWRAIRWPRQWTDKSESAFARTLHGERFPEQSSRIDGSL